MFRKYTQFSRETGKSDIWKASIVLIFKTVRTILMIDSLYLPSLKSRVRFDMELTERERLMLLGKKEEIQNLTAELLEIMNKAGQVTNVKTKITDILSILSTIGSYAKSRDFDLSLFTIMADSIFQLLPSAQLDTKIREYPIKRIERFCIYANSIQFDLTKKDLRIIIPKIDLSIFRTK
jgi:hypothetical protein